jgi:hypothetical protein
MITATVKRIETLAWYFQNAQNKAEQIDAIRAAYILGGDDGVEALARLVKRNKKKLVKLAELSQLRQQMNRWRRGRGLRPSVDPLAGLGEIAATMEKSGEYREARRDNTASKGGSEINPTKTGRRQSGSFDPEGPSTKNSVMVYINKDGERWYTRGPEDGPTRRKKHPA